MKMQLVAIYDRKSESFISMEPTPHIGVATRALGEIVSKPSEHNLHKWPEDFSLWHVGEWDTSSGVITPMEKNKIVEASTMKPTSN